MTKADLVEKVAERTGLTRTDVAVVVDAFLDTVKKSVEAGHNIEMGDLKKSSFSKKKFYFVINPYISGLSYSRLHHF